MSRFWLLDLITLGLLFAVFYAIWIGSYPLFTPDEGRYSEVAREMVVTGDYITPRLNAVAFLDKPILYYWLQALAINLFGLKEWALRFFPASAGILTVLVTYVCGRITFNRRTGWLAAIMLALSPLFYGAAHYANLDLEVAAFVSNSLLFFLASISELHPQRKTFFLYAAYFFAALAALTKGLIGIVFPAMIIGLWIVILNRWRMLLQIRLLSGLLLFSALTLPWYFAVQKANPEFLHFFFYTQQVSRFLTTQAFNSKAVVWFYVPVVLAGFFPWSIFLFQTLWQKIKLIFKNRQQHAADLFLLLWFSLIFIFFSIPHSKTVGYILPIFPALALLVASYLDSMWDNPNTLAIRGARSFFIVIGCLLGFTTMIAPYYQQIFDISMQFMPFLRYMALTILVSALCLLNFPKRKNLLPLFSVLTGTIAVLLLIFISSAISINEKTVKPLVGIVSQVMQDNDEVVAYYKYYQDLPLYTQRRVTIVADWHAKDIADNDNWLRELWYGMVFQDTRDWLIEEDTFWQKWNSDKRLFVFTNVDYSHALAKKTQVYKVAQRNDIVVLTNKSV